MLGEIANPLMKRVMDLKNSALEDSTTSGSETTVGDYRNLDTESAATDVQKAGLTSLSSVMARRSSHSPLTAALDHAWRTGTADYG